MKSPADVLLAIVQMGGKLGIAGDKLRTLLPPNCTELKDAIRQHKSALMELWRLTFLVVRSDELNVTVFWTPDEATKQALVAAGAQPGHIYSAGELEMLVRHRITVTELLTIHAVKQRFNGKLSY